MSQQINLFNPVFLRKKKYFSAATMAQALGFIAAGMVVFSAYSSYQVKKLAAAAAQSQAQLDSQRTQLANLVKQQAPGGKSTALADELARTEVAAKTRRDLLTSLRTGALGNVKGFSRYLAALARSRTDGVWLTGVAVGGDENDLQVRGRVLRPELVPEYLQALNTEEVMRGRRVTELTLTAVRETKAEVAAGQAGATTAPAAAHEPTRFVEFSVVAPRRPEEATKSDAGRRAPS